MQNKQDKMAKENEAQYKFEITTPERINYR